MELTYLIDTNCAIDYLNDMLPPAGALLIDASSLKMSVITRMELLGWPNASPENLVVLQEFVEACTVYNLDEPTVLKTIELRRSNRIKLPDAIIAATAVIHNLPILTRNTGDFSGISQLQLLNPHQ